MQPQTHSLKTASGIRPHWVLMLVTFLYILINITHPELKGTAIACSIGLFVFYTWRRILIILITAAIAFALVAIFPFLAPVAFILMVIIFIARLSYILKNWRAVLAGFYMYALAFGFAFYGSVFGGLIWGFSFYHYRLNGVEPLLGYQGVNYTLAAVVALFFTGIFHFIMHWLYRHHYTLQQALPIMGVAPLLILLLCLPFLKAFDSFETGVDTVDTGGHSFDGMDGGHVDTDGFGHGDTGDFSHPDIISHDSMDTGHDISDAPGVHHTHDYFRTGPNGEVQHVRGYEATNPDGIVENNYSYHGDSYADGTDTPVSPDSVPIHGADGSLTDTAAADDPLLAGAEARLEKERKREKELSLDDAIQNNRNDC